jgi:RNA polymerase sigma factor (sigma-70 family)
MESAVSGSPDAARREQLRVRTARDADTYERTVGPGPTLDGPRPDANAAPSWDGSETEACSAEIFGQLYLSAYPALVTYCRRLLGRAIGRHDFPGRCDPEDLAQEALLRAWHARERYSPERPFMPWVTTIAHRLFIDYQRHAMHVATTLRAEGPAIADTGVCPPMAPEEVVELTEERRLAQAAMARLNPKYQRLLELWMEGVPYLDIGVQEDLSVEAVRGSLRRARKALRSAYYAHKAFRPSEAYCRGCVADRRATTTTVQGPR